MDGDGARRNLESGSLTLGSKRSTFSLKGYGNLKVLLERDETGSHIVVFPSLPGCYSQGETVEEAMENIEEAILLCLEDMQAMEIR
jgi:predicted RNase H-like HicB family nuclease